MFLKTKINQNVKQILGKVGSWKWLALAWSWRTDLAALGRYVLTTSEMISFPALRTQSISTYCWLSAVGPDWEIFGSRSGRTDLAALGPYALTSSQISSRSALPLSQEVHIIYPPTVLSSYLLLLPTYLPSTIPVNLILSATCSKTVLSLVRAYGYCQLFIRPLFS